MCNCICEAIEPCKRSALYSTSLTRVYIHVVIYIGIHTFIRTFKLSKLPRTVINPRRACAERLTVVVSCVCMYVCLSEHAILAVRAIRSITKDAIVLSVRFAAILKWRFS